jgi:hypothetical protein
VQCSRQQVLLDKTLGFPIEVYLSLCSLGQGFRTHCMGWWNLLCWCLGLRKPQVAQLTPAGEKRLQQRHGSVYLTTTACHARLRHMHMRATLGSQAGADSTAPCGSHMPYGDCCCWKEVPLSAQFEGVSRTPHCYRGSEQHPPVAAQRDSAFVDCVQGTPCRK